MGQIGQNVLLLLKDKYRPRKRVLVKEKGTCKKGFFEWFILLFLNPYFFLGFQYEIHNT